MLAKLTSCTPVGVSGLLIDVEVDIGLGLPVFATVGLPDSAVRESKDRVKSAIKNCGYDFPNKKITINLAPADVKKEGAGFDLPIALGILSAAELLDMNSLAGCCVVGELSLDGRIRRVNGLLPMVIAARNANMKTILIPAQNSEEASICAQGIDVIPVDYLPEAVDFLAGLREIEPLASCQENDLIQARQYTVDFAEVRGQQHVKRAMEIAASGGHNMLMKGPPGSGKTMLARRLPTILPDMSYEEVVETTKIYSLSAINGTGTGSIISNRPFRAPHHTISDAGLIGGGNIPRPGEVSMAHNGVLFLDELPEFKRHVLEVLRQPLEDGTVTIARANMTLSFPAQFVLVVAMNPCPCGFLGDARNECSCSHSQIQRYESRVSGPLLDRIDLHLEVAALQYDEMSGKEKGETSADIRERVNRARTIQEARFKRYRQLSCNAQMGTREIDKFCPLASSAEQLLHRSVEQLGLSARGYHRILKIARTIADMEEKETLGMSHVAEAIQLRRLQT